MKNILVVGSTNIDYVVQVQAIAKVGETILGKSFELLRGGKGANQALAVCKLGQCGTYLTVVGKEVAIYEMKSEMEANGMDCAGITHVDCPSGSAFISVNAQGNNSIVVAPSANSQLDIPYLDAHQGAFDKADYLLIQMEIPMDSVYHAIQKAHKKGASVVLNPAPAPNSIPTEILTMLDYITPNETELATISGLPTDTQEEIALAAQKLRAMGVKNVLVTMGDKGAMVVSQEGTFVYSGRQVKAVDTTAAGDTFNGGFVAGLAEGMSVADAIGFANVAAALSVSRKGAQSSIPTRAEVDALLKI